MTVLVTYIDGDQAFTSFIGSVQNAIEHFDNNLCTTDPTIMVDSIKFMKSGKVYKYKKMPMSAATEHERKTIRIN